MVRKSVQKTVFALSLGATFWALAGQGCVSAQEVDAYAFSARVWLDRGDEPVLQAGDRVRIYYRTSEDAHVAIFQVNTDGFTRLVYPRSPQENTFVRGGRDYRLLLPQSPYWYVDDAPGVGYFFIVATREPLDFSAFPYSFSSGGWDLSLVGQHIYTDPFLAMDDFVAALVPEWETMEYGLDFLTYHVGQIHDYPRFLCYDCHGYQPYYAWNPYYYSCTSFRLVIWDDPYYYPVYRYSGTRVVYTRPPAPGYNPRFSFKERADGEPAAPEVIRRSSAGTSSAGGSSRAGVQGDLPGGQATSTRGNPGGAQTPASVDRRPSGTSAGTASRIPNLPGVIPGGASSGSPGRAQTLSPGNGRSSRPVLERRPTVPSARTGGVGSQGTTRPSARVRSGGSSGVPSAGSAPNRGQVPASGTSGGVPSRVRTSGNGGTAGPTAPTARTSRPAVKTGTGGSARPAVRPKTGGSGGARPAVKPKSGGGSPRPAVKPKSGGGSSRPAVKPKSGGGSPRPAVKPKGSGGGPPAASPRSSGGSAPARPAPRPRGSGGGMG